MVPDDRIQVTIARRREQWPSIDDRRLRRAVESGRWIRVATGSFAPADEWGALPPMEQHRIRVLETLRSSHGPVLVSHRAAAALWGIDQLRAWPTRIDVRIERASGGRTSGDVRRHAWGLAGVDWVRIGRHSVTTPAQTALDLARSLPPLEGLCAVDQALWAGRKGGALATLDRIARLAQTGPLRRGDVRAHRVLGLASPLAANVRETQSRFVIRQLGFPDPVLQRRFELPSGRIVFADFYFEEYDHWGELDGRGKYLLNGDAAAAVIDEKNRENEIRREVTAFSRWEPSDVDNPRRLYDILTGAGLPSRLPRP